MIAAALQVDIAQKPIAQRFAGRQPAGFKTIVRPEDPKAARKMYSFLYEAGTAWYSTLPLAASRTMMPFVPPQRLILCNYRQRMLTGLGRGIPYSECGAPRQRNDSEQQPPCGFQYIIFL